MLLDLYFHHTSGQGSASGQVDFGGGFAYPLDRGFDFLQRRRKELEDAEPVVAQELEALALKSARADDRTLSAAQVQAHLNSIGLAYEQAYQEIYIGLIQEIEQEREFAAIAMCMAALL